MRPTTIEHNLKESHVINQLNKLGFYDTAGKSYRELKMKLALERAKQVEVSSSKNAWF